MSRLDTQPSTLDPEPVKSPRTAEIIAGCQGQGLDPHYLGFFACFNQQLFYEAHEALEQLWLPARRTPEAAFYKGLIQMAGAFVHLQKGRIRPAAALFRLAKNNLQPYSPVQFHLNIGAVLRLIEDWHSQVTAPEFQVKLFATLSPPKLQLSDK